MGRRDPIQTGFSDPSPGGALFERVFEQGPIGMVLVSTGFRFLRVNRAFCRMTGYEAEDLVGVSFADITHPDDVDLDVDLAGKVFRGEIPSYEMEKRYVRKDGTLAWVRLNASVIFDEKGEPRFGLGLMQDVTDRKQAEERLRRSLEHFRLIAEQAVDVISLDDAQGRVLYVSPSIRDVLGYDPDEIRGRDTRELLHPDDAERVWQIVERSRESGEIPTLVYRFLHRDGRYRWLESTARQTVDLDTGERRLLAITRDVTDRKRVERMRQDLVAMLSHDIRNPLATILGLVDLLRPHLQGPEATELLGLVDVAARRGLGLAASYIDSARVESGEIALHRVPASVNAVLRSIVREQEPVARSRAVRLETILADHLPELPLDSSLMRRAVGNLLDNAIKFSPPGGVVRVTSRVDPDRIVIAVADQGPGVSEQKRDRLYARYATADPDHDGTGLGLFIVREVVEAHGGSVSARFPESGGSRFEIALPRPSV